ncbi:hypothetical protein HRG_001478 [Hirsutella rhossiliensis]|uniref:Uncharacterized protein n=1 Tax=Hirsutella rhossiliensis TaxID=111463 RepID=A0A9P8SNA0_9HYPO|nr:uncharacterized protein HRG_01478 [Hirsutella rhossiliensis]KAH0968836.1 hypothetical protein HRG_01478 [Hirsutella rhossiliensis]
MTTKKEKIRSIAKKLIELDYDEAVEAVKKVEAHLAAKMIQVRYDETMFWNIIKKAAARLDPTTLPTPKGVLDEFSREEKAATEKFIKEAGQGPSQGSTQALSSDELGVPLDIKGLKSGSRNKSVFVSLLAKDEAFLWVCSVTTMNKDDRLGVFVGHLRHSEGFDTTWGIKGPRENLWLDYSKVTGLLNQMRVSQQGGDANVRLHWELCDVEGRSEPTWTVSAWALKTIRPFEEFVRCAEQEAQFRLHQDPACARKGFLR